MRLGTPAFRRAVDWHASVIVAGNSLRERTNRRRASSEDLGGENSSTDATQLSAESDAGLREGPPIDDEATVRHQARSS